MKYIWKATACAASLVVAATAFAAMAAVPIEEIRLCVISLPNWNILLSIPFGTPIRRISLMIGKSGR